MADADIGPLPPPWVAHRSRTHGKVYFFNPKTGVSTFERPQFPPSQSSQAHAPPVKATPTPTPSASAPTKTASITGLSAPAALLSQPAGAGDGAVAFDKTTAEGYHFKDAGVQGRTQKPGVHLFYFNNWVKACLINEYGSHAKAVLDLACGKMGDRRKWEHVQRYVGIDISDVQIKDACARFKDAGSPFDAKFIRGDLGAVDLSRTGALELNERFDAISIQFALHYLFKSEVWRIPALVPYQC